MQRLTRMLLAAALPILAAVLSTVVAPLAAGCNQSPGTSLRVALDYDDALGLDIAEVTLADRTQPAPIAHELLLLVPDDLAGQDIPVEVWALKADKRVAFGAATTVPKLGKTVALSLALTACTPGCQADQLTTCTGPTTTCALGCSTTGNAHCIAPTPSNGVDPASAAPLNGTTTIAANTTFDVDTGAITGGLTRAAGPGTDGGIGYVQAPAFGAGGAPLGIFVFHNLTVQAAATVRFTGTRAAVLLVGDAAKIAGVLDVSAGQGARTAPGPGGGAGGTDSAPAKGCGAGVAGKKSGTVDSGGGAGGGGQTGAPGGAIPPLTFSAGGAQCLPMRLEPLQGGSGGGRGSPGNTARSAGGGGGGGALQITALGSLEITGTISAGGAGGEGGPASALDAGSGAGGGGGGGILVEAPTVTIGPTALLVANGGGGGGGGDVLVAGEPGENALLSSNIANGGTGQSSDSGGTGGALTSPPDVGGDGPTNGNGGGGGAGVGAIVIRGHMRTIGGTISPAAVVDDVHPPS
jgi:hypothetical protein